MRRLPVVLLLFFVAIALTLAFATVAYAAEVKSENGNTVAVISGEGGVSGGTTMSAGDSAEAIKSVSIELTGPGSASLSDSGPKSASDPYVTAEINCNIVSYAVSATEDGYCSADAEVYASGDEDFGGSGEVWVEAEIWTDAYATSSDTGSATAVAKASGWAKATGTWDAVGGSISASAEGIATSNATSSGDSYAYNLSYIYSYAEVGQEANGVWVYDYCDIYSGYDGCPYGSASGDKALASGTAQGKADASATAGGEKYLYTLSSTTSVEGRVLTQAAASGDGYTEAYAEIYAENEAFAGGWYEGYYDMYWGVYTYDESYLETNCRSYSESDTYLGSASALAGGSASSDGSASYSYTPESTVTDEATSQTSAQGNVLSRLSQKAGGHTSAYAEIYAYNWVEAGEGYYYYDGVYVYDYSELYTDCYARGYSDSYLGSALAQAGGSASSSGSASYSYTETNDGTVTETAQASSGTSAQGKLLSRLAQKAEGRTDADAEIYAENDAGAYYSWYYDYDEAWVYDYSYLWTHCWTDGYSDNYVGSALTQVEGSASSSSSATYTYTITPMVALGIPSTFTVTDEASAESSAQGKILNRVSQKADGYTYAEAEIYGGYYEGGAYAYDGWYYDGDGPYYYYYAYADGESELYTYCYSSSDSESFVGAALVQAEGVASANSSASYTYTITPMDMVINPSIVIVTVEASADTSASGKVLSRLAQKSYGSTQTGAEIYGDNYGADAYYDDNEGDYYYYYDVYDDSGLDAYGNAGSDSASFVAVALSLAQGSASSNGSADYNYYLYEGCGGTSDTSASGKLTAQLAQQAAGSTHADGIIMSDNWQPDYGEEMGLPGFYLDIEYASMFEMSRISTGAHAYGSSELYKGTAVAQAQGETSASGSYGWYSSDGLVYVEHGTSTTEASGKTIMARAGATMLGHADALAGIASLNLVDAYGYIIISIVSPGITVENSGTEVDFGYDGYGAVVDLSFFGAMTETSDPRGDTATALATAQGSTDASGDYIWGVGEFVDHQFEPTEYLWEQSSDTAAQGTAMARSQAQMAESGCLAGAISVNIAGLVDGDISPDGYVPTVFDLSLAGTESHANGGGKGAKASAMGTLAAATSASGTLFEGYCEYYYEDDTLVVEAYPDLILHSATAVGATLADSVSGLAKATSLAAISGDAGAMAIAGLASGNGAQNWYEGEGSYLGLGDLSLLIATANAGSGANSSANAVATATGATTSASHGYVYDFVSEWESEGWSETTASGSALSSAATTGPAGAGSTAIIYSYETGDDYWYELAGQSVIVLESGSSVGEGGSAVTKAVVNKGAASASSDWWIYGEPVASSDTSVSGSGIIAITNKLGEVEAIVNVVAFQDVYFGDGKSTDAFVGFGCGVWASDGSPTYSSASVTGVNAHAYADPDGLVSEAWVDNGWAKALLKPNVNYGIAGIGYDEVGASAWEDGYVGFDELVSIITNAEPNRAIAYSEAGADSDEPPYLYSFPFWGF